jgi:predicted DNA-binding protein YlxM (UPF0122 family)
MSKGIRITMKQLKHMKTLHNRGNSKTEVAKIMNLSTQSIYIHLKNHTPDILSGNEASIKVQSKNKVIEDTEDLIPEKNKKRYKAYRKLPNWKPEKSMWMKKIQEKRRDSWSLPCCKEDHDYVSDLAQKQDVPMRIIIRQLVVKHKKRWWSF